jgi:hypothetical protein
MGGLAVKLGLIVQQMRLPFTVFSMRPENAGSSFPSSIGVTSGTFRS